MDRTERQAQITADATALKAEISKRPQGAVIQQLVEAMGVKLGRVTSALISLDREGLIELWFGSPSGFPLSRVTSNEDFTNIDGSTIARPVQ